MLSYNLFWWNLYGVRGGNGESAGHLIKAETVEDTALLFCKTTSLLSPAAVFQTFQDGLFDVMGFQECENGIRVLKPVRYLKRTCTFVYTCPVRTKVGLMDSYEVLQGLCLILMLCER